MAKKAKSKTPESRTEEANKTKNLTIYVDPRGDDRWSGLGAEPAADGSDGPVATLGRAQEMVRAWPKSEGGAVRVYLRGGVHRLTETWVLRPEDSGTAECPVIYAAYPGEQPVLSGGRVITGWSASEVHGRPCWVADLPEVRAGRWNFTQLFVNGRRGARPRWPRHDYARFTAWQAEDPARAEFAPGELRAWHNLEDVKLVTLQYWEENHLRFASVDVENRTACFRAAPERKPVDEEGRFARYFVENVFEELSEPGEWYLDRAAGRLYYLPREGETPETVEVVAPVLGELVRFAGTEKQSVRHIVLENLSLQHAEWDYPPERTASLQAAVLVPGAVRLEHAMHCVLYGCEIARVAHYGIEMQDGCSGNRVIACVLHDLGAGGVRLGNHDKPVFAGQEREERDRGLPMNATVTDCEIHDGGKIFPSAIGIWIGDCGFNRVAHNHVHHFNYTGISSGWTWGYADTATVENRIEYNHIHHINWDRLLSDNGGIYTLGRHPGSVVRGNVIHHVGMYHYGGRGLYPDEGTTGLLLENNLVYRCDGPGYRTHFGRDNHARNNILALCASPQIMLGNKEDGRAATFERNIVYWREGYLEIDGTPGYALYQGNTFWGGAADPDMGWGMRLADWQAMGQHAKTVIADPLFVDPEGDNFTLRADSPALAAGFVPFDPRLAGPRFQGTRPVSFLDWPADEVPAQEILATKLSIAGDRIEVRVSNEGLIPATGRMRLKIEPPTAATLTEDPVVAVERLAPGETETRTFTLRRGGDRQSFWIETVPETPALWPTLLRVEENMGTWSIPRLAEKVTDASEVAAALATVPPRTIRTFKQEVAKVRLALSRDDLALVAEVPDLYLRRGQPLWNGSCVQIFAARPNERLPDISARNPQLLRQMFLVPAVGDLPAAGALLGSMAVVMDEIRVASQPTEEGYVLGALIPLSLLGIPAGSGEFLFEVLVDVPQANGTVQHTTLFGSPAPSANNRNYGQVVPVNSDVASA